MADNLGAGDQDSCSALTCRNHAHAIMLAHKPQQRPSGGAEEWGIALPCDGASLGARTRKPVSVETVVIATQPVGGIARKD
jgi:hypothetical protein